MTTHWAVIDRDTGDHDFAISETEGHPRGYSGETHRFKKLDRAPLEHDRFDGKRLIECAETRERIDGEAMLSRMSRSEFVDHILALVDARLKPD